MFKHTIGMILGKEKRADYYELLKEKNYVAVGQKYGKAVYHISVSGCRRRRIFKQLAKEGKLDVISQLYSKRKLKKAKVLATQYAAYKAEPNRVKAVCRYGLGRAVRCGWTWVILSFAMIYMCRTRLVSLYIKMQMSSQALTAETQYAAEIEAFDQKAVEYGVYLYTNAFNAEDHEDILVYNKIMDDMWSNIEGYGVPEMDLTGVARLDIVSENGVGVCRNMADYMVSVLDAQVMKCCKNPRKMYVDSEHGDMKLMDIDRKMVESAKEVAANGEAYNENEFAKKYAANHVIVAVDVNDFLEDVQFTLLIDPTNPSYGYLKNGEIVWINSAYDRDGNPNPREPYQATYKKLADYELNQGTAHRENERAFKNSYKLTQKAEEYIWAHYDLPQQNEALEAVRQIDDHDYVSETYFHGAVQEVLQ